MLFPHLHRTRSVLAVTALSTFALLGSAAAAQAAEVSIEVAPGSYSVGSTLKVSGKCPKQTDGALVFVGVGEADPFNIDEVRLSATGTFTGGIALTKAKESGAKATAPTPGAGVYAAVACFVYGQDDPIAIGATFVTLAGGKPGATPTAKPSPSGTPKFPQTLEVAPAATTPIAQSGNTLPKTGSDDNAPIALGGLSLLGFGSALVLWMRRLRATAAGE